MRTAILGSNYASTYTSVYALASQQYAAYGDEGQAMAKTAEEAGRFCEEEHQENKRKAARKKANPGSVWRTGEEAGLVNTKTEETPAKMPSGGTAATAGNTDISGTADKENDIPDDILDMFGDSDEDD